MEQEWVKALSDLRRTTIVCGYYGCGKTTFSLNLARQTAGNDVTLIDLDIVNPYFRSSDYTGELEALGIRVIAPNFAGTMLDIPSLNPAVSGALETGRGRMILDAGGDDAGATALGCFAHLIQQEAYDMLYVINQSRPLASDPTDAARILEEIQRASRLACTGIVNNTHWGEGTTLEMIRDSFPFAAAVAERAGLPVRYTLATKELAEKLQVDAQKPGVGEILPVSLPVRLPWQG